MLAWPALLAARFFCWAPAARRNYEGTTLREHLGLPRPHNRFFPIEFTGLNPLRRARLFAAHRAAFALPAHLNVLRSNFRTFHKEVGLGFKCHPDMLRRACGHAFG
jgi:hypothetical protein